MTALRYHSSEMQAARRMTVKQLRLLGTPLKPSTSIGQMAEMIAERMGWTRRKPLPRPYTPSCCGSWKSAARKSLRRLTASGAQADALRPGHAHDRGPCRG